MNSYTALARLRLHEPELRRMGIMGLSLFGSVARGQGGPTSDVDLAATFAQEARIGVFAFAQIAEQLADVLECPVDLIGEPARKPAMQRQIDRAGCVPSERERQRLIDIIDNIDAIRAYAGAMDFAGFASDRKTIDATERYLQRITEAVIKIGPERMQAIAPALPLSAVRDLGNMLRHEYDSIDLRSIFNTLTDDLPTLRAAC